LAEKSWLLIKYRAFASRKDVTIEEPRSALSNRLLADIARDEGGGNREAFDS